MKKQRMTGALGAFLVFIGVAVSINVATAGTILQPVAATTDMGWYTTYDPVYAIDQSGLAAGYTSGVTDFDTFTASTGTVSAGSSYTAWYSQTSLTGNFDFDLGGLVNIESFALWADPQTAGQGVNSFNLLADDNAAFSSPTLLGNFSATCCIGNENNAINFGQVFTFAATSASYVRMEILSNHGSTATTGIVEAAFEVSAVPVPAAVWLFGSGLLGLAGMASRRKA